MGVHQPNFLTDSNVLAEAVIKRDPIKHPGHWSIRPNLHQILSGIQNLDARVIKIRRETNKIAHRQAQDAYKLHNVQACFYSCAGLAHNPSSCPVKVVISFLNVQVCTLLFTTCL